jgi:D-alanyl-D-alanine carboxypeptidase (penicillin-binding protein 5/6)
MNEKAKEFELKNTNFTNVMGFDDANHYSTSFDMGIIAHNLLKEYSNLILKYTSMTEDYLRKDEANPFWLVNTNKLLGDYDGMDGLKTGYTHEAGYCLTATSKRDNLRLIAVTMNAKTIKERSNDIKSLLNYGYKNYKSVKVFSKDELFMPMKFINSKNELDNIYIKDDIYITLPIKEKNNEYEYTYTIYKDYAPISNNEVIGQIEIYNSMGMIFYGELILKEDIELIKWYEYFLKVLKSLIL